MQIYNKDHAFFHQLILIILTLLVALSGSAFLININNQIALFLIITLTIGVFHGMLDIVLLKSAQFRFVKFLVVYASLATLALLFFLYFPNGALFTLLLLAIWHFGEAQQSDDTFPVSAQSQLIFKRFLLGASAIAATYFLANQSLHQILNILLLGSNWLSITWILWRLIAYAWLLIFVVYLIQLISHKTLMLNCATLLELIAVWLGFGLLPPLIAFSLYFGAYHAVRHIRDVLSQTGTINKHKASLICIALIALSILILVTFLLNNQLILAGLYIDAPAILLRSSIILLVVITLPHCLLISIWRRNFHHNV